MLLTDLSQVWCLEKIKVVAFKKHLLHSFQLHTACHWFDQLTFAAKHTHLDHIDNIYTKFLFKNNSKRVHVQYTTLCLYQSQATSMNRLIMLTLLEKAIIIFITYFRVMQLGLHCYSYTVAYYSVTYLAQYLHKSS